MRVRELSNWKEQRIAQQLTFPLDKTSIDIIQRDLFVAKEFVYLSLGGGVPYPFGIIGIINNKSVTLSAMTTPHLFTAATTDILTSFNHGFVNGDLVTIFTDGILPTPLTQSGYYVRDATANTFKLENTPGSGAINITDTGTGHHYAQLS